MAHRRGSTANTRPGRDDVLQGMYDYFRERKIIKAITLSTIALIIVGMCLSIVFIYTFSHIQFRTSSSHYLEDKILDHCFKNKKPLALKKIVGVDPDYCSNSLTPFSNDVIYEIMSKIAWEQYVCFPNLVIYSNFSHDGGGCIDSDNVGGIILFGPSFFIYTW